MFNHLQNPNKNGGRAPQNCNRAVWQRRYMTAGRSRSAVKADGTRNARQTKTTPAPTPSTHLVAHFDDPLLHPSRHDRPSSRDGKHILDRHQERLVQGYRARKKQIYTGGTPRQAARGLVSAYPTPGISTHCDSTLNKRKTCF